jgi:ABC-type branched-subunit amino acid transport system ATPase component
VTDPSPLLEIEHLDVAYGTVQVLFDVTLEVRRGETLALLGTNGAGKSTLLKAVSGLLAVQRGHLRFGGTDITTAPTDARVRAGIVQVQGGDAVFPTLTVRDNLRLGAFTFLDDAARVTGRIDHVLELFGVLRDRLEQRAGSLSGGEQQMLALAKALLPEPELLVIDELSLGLAPIVIERILVVIEQLKATGLSMLIVEQSLNVAMAFADRAAFMERGELRFTGDPAELVANGDLVRAVFMGAGGSR